MKRHFRILLVLQAILLRNTVAAQSSNRLVAVTWTVYPGLDSSTGIVPTCAARPSPPLTGSNIITDDNYNAVRCAPRNRYILFDFSNRLAVNHSPSVTQPSWATERSKAVRYRSEGDVVGLSGSADCGRKPGHN